MKTYTVQSAIDAQRMGYGKESYWDYLESSAKEAAAYYERKGLKAAAQLMLTRSLPEALAGNDGE